MENRISDIYYKILGGAMKSFKLNILGTDYTVKLCKQGEYKKLEQADANGLAEFYSQELIIRDYGQDKEPDNRVYDNVKGFVKKVIRHEIAHALFHESGLRKYEEDEELVDWLALQSFKFIETMTEAMKKYDKIK